MECMNICSVLVVCGSECKSHIGPTPSRCSQRDVTLSDRIQHTLSTKKTFISVKTKQQLQEQLPTSSFYREIKEKLEMWANAQRDGRPAEYSWRPLFNAAKFGWRPLLECHAVTLPRRETRWNLQGCPKLMKRSQPLVGRSSPYYGDMWRRYCSLTSFFRLLIHALVANI